MLELPLRISIVAEDRLGARFAKCWTIRRLAQKVEWFRDLLESMDEDVTLDITRVEDLLEVPLGVLCWLSPGHGRLYWKHAEAVPARGNSFRPMLHGKRAANLALKNLMFFQAQPPELVPSVVLFARDLDHAEGRAANYQVECPPPGIIPIFALANPEIEAWLVASVASTSENLRTRLEALRGLLGFDPRTAPEQLSSTSRNPRTGTYLRNDSKSVALALFPTDTEMAGAEHAAMNVDFHEVESHTDCGIGPFLRDIDRKLVAPLLS